MKKSITVSKSTIMIKAWDISKKAAVKFGGKAKDFFAESLHLVWEKAKKIANKVLVPNWFIKKNFHFELGTSLRKFEVVRETEKAVLVVIAGSEIWCPKSILENN